MVGDHGGVSDPSTLDHFGTDRGETRETSGSPRGFYDRPHPEDTRGRDVSCQATGSALPRPWSVDHSTTTPASSRVGPASDRPPVSTEGWGGTTLGVRASGSTLCVCSRESRCILRYGACVSRRRGPVCPPAVPVPSCLDTLLPRCSPPPPGPSLVSDPSSVGRSRGRRTGVPVVPETSVTSTEYRLVQPPSPRDLGGDGS